MIACRKAGSAGPVPLLHAAHGQFLKRRHSDSAQASRSQQIVLPPLRPVRWESGKRMEPVDGI